MKENEEETRKKLQYFTTTLYLTEIYYKNFNTSVVWLCIKQVYLKVVLLLGAMEEWETTDLLTKDKDNVDWVGQVTMRQGKSKLVTQAVHCFINAAQWMIM